MTFDKDVARDVGTNAAIIYSNIIYWCAHNKANNKHYYEGRYWTYNSINAFNNLFDYLSPKQIRTCLKKLKDNGYIITGNFNANKYDRTIWYSCKMDLPEKENVNYQKGKAIPNSKPNTKPNTLDTELKIQVRLIHFQKELGRYKDKYDRKLLRRFYDYWTEPNRSGTKMRFEMQKTWDMSRRLKRWENNDFNNDSKKKVNNYL